MSDFGFRFTPRPVSLSGELTVSRGFRADNRFDASPRFTTARPLPEGQLPPGIAPAPLSDPVADAWSQGFEAGFHQAAAEAAAQQAEAAQAVEALTLAFARMNTRMEEELRLRLRETVAALCEAAIAPMTLDPEALSRRVAKAAGMLARADDERVVRLHPEDLKLVAERLSPDWKVEPDPSLERGTVRVEAACGGVEDSPALWREAIREALHQC
ncbi:flagellar assembly protein FliH [Novosphingobium sp. 9]|uniref:FliH/SctL family protein n=1 Tax=Novosphingobium sp. 9 TaxID=2025349 RepID=UPI0021B62EAD|nr:flagellar assembly protein FliH [Novosphingobium sp. 9]